MKSMMHSVQVAVMAGVVAVALLCGNALRATSFAWDNAADGNWTESAKWNPDGDPNSSGDTVSLGDLGGAYGVTLAATRTVGGLTLSGSDPTLTVNGTLIQSGGSSTVSGGTLNGSGTVQLVAGATVNWSSLTAPGGALTWNAPESSANPLATINNTGTWGIASGQKLTIDGDYTGDTNTHALVVTNGFVNAGEIRLGTLPSDHPASKLQLTVNSGTLTNAGTGAIYLYPRSNNPINVQDPWSVRTIAAQLDNDGQFTCYTPVGYLDKTGANHVNDGTLSVNSSVYGGSGNYAALTIRGSSFTNNGNLSIDANSTLIIETPTFNYNSGSIVGPGVLSLGKDNAAITVNWNGPDPVSAYTFRVTAGAWVTLNRTTPWNILSGQTLQMYTPQALTPGMSLTVNQDINNSGTIRMGNLDVAPTNDPYANQTITLTSPNRLLTNNLGGNFIMHPRSTTNTDPQWSYRKLDAELLNYGQFTVYTWNGYLGAPGDDHINLGAITLDSSQVPAGKVATLSVSGSSFTNQPGGVINGNGALIFNAGAGTLTNHGTLAPGLSVGTLAVQGNLLLASDSILNYEFGPGTASDLIQVTGNLTLDGTMLVDAGFVPGTYYTIFNVTGAVTDNGLVVGNLPGYRTVWQRVGNDIRFTAIPEPGTAVLAALAGLLAMRRRRSHAA